MAANDFIYASMPSELDMPIKNTDVVAFAAGDVVKVDTANPVSGTQGVIGALRGTAAAVNSLGVCMEAIPIGQQGRIRPLGPVVPVTASAAIAAGVLLAPAASGQVAAQGAAGAQIGLSLTAAAAANDKLLMMMIGAKNA